MAHGHELLAWHHGCRGRDEKDLVVLPYEERLLLLNRGRHPAPCASLEGDTAEVDVRLMSRRLVLGSLSAAAGALALGCRGSAGTGPQHDGGVIPISDAGSDPGIDAGTDAGVDAGQPADFGVLGAAAASLGAGEWLDWTADTNAQAITDVHPSDGVALAWLESQANYYLTNWPGKATWDEVTKQILVSGAAQGLSSEVPAGAHHSVVFLDVKTGQLSKQWNPFGENLGHIYDSNCSAFAPDGKLYRRSWTEGGLHGMTRARQWSPVGEQPSLGTYLQGGLAVPSLDVHPSLGPQGSLLFCAANGRLIRVDLATRATTVLAGEQPGVLGSYCVLAYHPSIDACVFGGGEGGTSLYRVDASAVISPVTQRLPPGIVGLGPDGNSANSVLVPDPLQRPFAWLFDFVSTRRVWRLDLSSGEWGDRGAMPAEVNLGAIATITGLGVHVLLQGEGRATPTRSNSRIWVYRA